MKRIDFIGFATALLAGSTLMGVPAVAQEASTSTKPRLASEAGVATTTQQPPDEASSGTQAAPDQTEGSAAGSGSAQVSGSASSDLQDETTGAAEASTEQIQPADEDDTADADAASEARPDQQQAEDAGNVVTDEEPQDQANDQSTDEPSNETTASINITNEQQVEIRSVIQEVDAEPVSVDFDINVGVAVPQTVELRPLPSRIVEVVPQYEGFQYFLLADGRIIIVEPATMEVVYIIVA